MDIDKRQIRSCKYYTSDNKHMVIELRFNQGYRIESMLINYGSLFSTKAEELCQKDYNKFVRAIKKYSQKINII